ncbi:MAG TPA: PH domain-containing protein [Methanomicrobiales archaeon]|nr:PH domain-containing protein [Methanomicrobiales archaeon]
MAESSGRREIRVGDIFKPAPQFKTLYYVYLILSILVFVLPYAIPVILFTPLIVVLSINIPTLAILGFTAFWIPLFYDTMAYQLTETEISWRRGVWFRQTGIVPYTRITNIDIVQGPVMRALGISALRIQTAGYSGQAVAELRLQGIRHPEELRELILGFVRGTAPIATGTYEAPTLPIDLQILQELKEIRKLLSAQTGKE